MSVLPDKALRTSPSATRLASNVSGLAEAHGSGRVDGNVSRDAGVVDEVLEGDFNEVNLAVSEYLGEANRPLRTHSLRPRFKLVQVLARHTASGDPISSV